MNAITLSELAAVRAVAPAAAPSPGDLARGMSQVPSQAPLQVKPPVLQFSWQSRFGIMLIEVRGDAVYVNGQRVEPVPPGL